MILYCSGINHAANSAQPDWQDELGICDTECDGMVCEACARLDYATPAAEVVF